MLFSKENKITHALWGRIGVRYHSTWENPMRQLPILFN